MRLASGLLRWIAVVLTLAYGRAWRWALALATLLVGRVLRRRALRQAAGRRRGRIVPPALPAPRAETVVVVLLAISAVMAIGFIVIYAEFGVADLSNELLGICLGLSLAAVAAALTVIAKRLVVSEEVEEPYPQAHPEEQEKVVEIVHESAEAITRRRLLVGAALTAGGALGISALTPALSLGPLWYTDPLYRTPWRRGLRLVDQDGRPYTAAEVEEDTFYTAFPEGAKETEELGGSVVLVRLPPGSLELSRDRATWAPQGIVAYSKICTHAGCAVALYRKPTFPLVEPKPALVCPCHYSTFDPARAAAVIYGPAGRPLPQLPLQIDAAGYLRAAGNFSGPVGPSWWGVRSGSAR